MLQLKIGQHIDHFGFNGREYHPKDTDRGLICRVLIMESIFLETSMDDTEKIVSENLRDGESINVGGLMEGAYSQEDFKALKNRTVDVYYAITEDHRLLEVMEHEIESITMVRE